MGKGDLPDIGGRHFVLLEPPRIALVRPNTSMYWMSLGAGPSSMGSWEDGKWLYIALQQGVRDRVLGSSAHVYVWKPAGIPDYRAEVRRLLATA